MYLDLLSFVYLLWCLLGVRVRALQASTKEDKQKPLQNIIRDDSGSKLRDKEQQRLSSK